MFSFSIDVACASENGIAVSHTPGVLTDATANQAFALLLSLARSIVPAHQYVQQKRFKRFETMLMLGPDLAHSRLGVIGSGRIGQALTKRARAFGMEVVYFNRSSLPEETEKSLQTRYYTHTHKSIQVPHNNALHRRVSLDELLSTSDFVSVHCPLNDDSYHCKETPIIIFYRNQTSQTSLH